MGCPCPVSPVVELLIILHMSAAQTPLTKEKESAELFSADEAVIMSIVRVVIISAGPPSKNGMSRKRCFRPRQFNLRLCPTGLEGTAQMSGLCTSNTIEDGVVVATLPAWLLRWARRKSLLLFTYFRPVYFIRARNIAQISRLNFAEYL